MIERLQKTLTFLSLSIYNIQSLRLRLYNNFKQFWEQRHPWVAGVLSSTPGNFGVSARGRHKVCTCFSLRCLGPLSRAARTWISYLVFHRSGTLDWWHTAFMHETKRTLFARAPRTFSEQGTVARTLFPNLVSRN